ncbi:hypothetical protein LINGRAHAP2_LOCUS5228, partial [Linum grandiflorum]
MLLFSSKVEKNDDCHEDFDEDEIAFLSKQVSRFLKFKRDKKKAGFQPKSKNIESEKIDDSRFQNKSKVKKDNTTNSTIPSYFKCGRMDHVKANCPLVKREKEKAFLAAWGASDEESDESDNDEVTTYMSIDTEEESKDTTDSITEVCYKVKNGETNGSLTVVVPII